EPSRKPSSQVDVPVFLTVTAKVALAPAYIVPGIANETSDAPSTGGNGTGGAGGVGTLTGGAGEGGAGCAGGLLGSGEPPWWCAMNAPMPTAATAGKSNFKRLERLMLDDLARGRDHT